MIAPSRLVGRILCRVAAVAAGDVTTVTGPQDHRDLEAEAE